MTRQTHTFAKLAVSRTAYDEIADKLRDAGYDHVFGRDGEMDMHGIALVVVVPHSEGPRPISCSRCGSTDTESDGRRPPECYCRSCGRRWFL